MRIVVRRRPVAVIAACLALATVAFVVPALTLADGATLVFLADGLDGDLGYADEVRVGALPVHTFTTGHHFMGEVRVPLPARVLHTGVVDVEIASGQLGGVGPYDEFTIRDVHLVMSDGTVVFDPRYPRQADLVLRDGPENPLDPQVPQYLAPQRVVESTLDGTEILTRDFRFVLPVASGGTSAHGDVVAAWGGSGDAKPLRGLAAREEAPLDPAPLAVDDGHEVVTTVEVGVASQRFDVGVTTDADLVDVSWAGRTTRGRGASLYAWDHPANMWREVARTEPTLADGTGGRSSPRGTQRHTLHAVVDRAAMVRDGVVSLLVQERSFRRADDEDFTVAWITDTQYYADSYPWLYEDMNRWIADVQDDENIVYVTHTGDIVEVFDDESQWIRSSSAQKILDDAGIPNGVLPGNHDNGSGQTRQEHALYVKYFGADRYDPNPWYGGTLYDNENHFDVFTVCPGDSGPTFLPGSAAAGRPGCSDLLFLYLGWVIGGEEIAWANQVLASHPDHQAVIAVHEYIGTTGAYQGQGQQIFDQVVLPNEQVFTVLAGHVPGVAYNVQRVPTPDGSQRVVLEILSDYQFERLGGLGYLRLLRFDEQMLQLDIDTWSPYLSDADMERYAHDEEDFTVPLHWRSRPTLIATDWIAAA
jgi:hypothetical protein